MKEISKTEKVGKTVFLVASVVFFIVVFALTIINPRVVRECADPGASIGIGAHTTTSVNYTED